MLKNEHVFVYHDWFTCFFLCTLIFSQSQGTSHNSTILLHKSNRQLDGIMLGDHFLRQLFRIQRSVWCVKIPVVVNGMKPSLLGVLLYIQITFHHITCLVSISHYDPSRQQKYIHYFRTVVRICNRLLEPKTLII